MSEETISGVLKFNVRSSIFKIFLNDLYFFIETSELSNYADDNTLYSPGNDLEKVKKYLKGRP